KTGALIGGAVGVVAASVFLLGFCSDPDALCETDEYARALFYIALPPTVVGALIGSLVRTGR
ncbi:MAG TPA: hypothetical protein VF771_11495, partial [Longimicrobiaceae bacterium]